MSDTDSDDEVRVTIHNPIDLNILIISSHLYPLQLFYTHDNRSTHERNPNYKIDVNCIQYDPKNHDVGDDNYCSICQAEYVKNDALTVLSCDHIFHNKCIEEWGHFNASCPICRAEIPLL